MSKKQKKKLARIALCAGLFLLGELVPVVRAVKLAVFLAAYGIIGYDVLKKAVRNLSNGQMLDENFLMSIATIGAFAVGEYPEG
ncbi:MAG: heavy metal translocating P-type ATPase, partial [Pygmaiobacter sp.]